MTTTMPRSVGAFLVVGAIAIGFASWNTSMAAISNHASSNESMIEHGIGFALRSQSEHAESLFVAALSVDPSSSAALTNLGNLALLRGDPEIADAFYLDALSSDPLDAGIRLNRSLALLALDRVELAEQEAATAVRALGGPEEAGALLGIRRRVGRQGEQKAEDSLVIDEESLRRWLEMVELSIPSRDSTATPSDGPAISTDTGILSPAEPDSVARIPIDPEKRPKLKNSDRAVQRATKALDVPQARLLYWKQ